MGVPLFNYKGDRKELNDWAKKKGGDGIKEYWKNKNTISLDDKPIHKLPI